MEMDETKGDWIFHKIVEHIDTLNKMVGAEVVDQVITDSAGDMRICLTLGHLSPRPWAIIAHRGRARAAESAPTVLSWAAAAASARVTQWAAECWPRAMPQWRLGLVTERGRGASGVLGLVTRVPKLGIPAGTRIPESDSGFGPARSRFLGPDPTRRRARRRRAVVLLLVVASGCRLGPVQTCASARGRPASVTVAAARPGKGSW